MELQLRRDHQRQSRRPRRRRLASLRRDRPRSPARAARGARRSADAGFLRRPGCRGARARRRAARLQPQHGDRAAPVRAGASAGRITGSRSTCWRSPGASARRRSTKSGFMVGLGETDDEVRALLRDLHAAGHGRGDHRPISAAHAPQSARRRISSSRRSSTRTATTACPSASRWSSADRWCAAPTWRTLVSDEAQRSIGAELAAGAALRGAADPHLSPILHRLVAPWRSPRCWSRSRASRAGRAASCSAGRAGIVYWFGVCYWIQFVLAVPRRRGRLLAGWAAVPAFCVAKALHLARLRAARRNADATMVGRAGGRCAVGGG